MVNEHPRSQQRNQKNAQLSYSKKAVKKAGDHIRKGCDESTRAEAIDIIRNFRASHLYPLMLIKNHINRIAQKVSQDYILARRLKRLPTIIDKLERPTLDGTTSNAILLTRMQDIGGCRVIFDTVEEVYDCLARLKRSTSVHKIVAIDDWLFSPKLSGYRGVHVVFSCYDNDDSAVSPWKKHKIEVQLRTRLQHAWATCVEMIDIFEQTQLKTRLQGDIDYRQFFQVAAKLMAVEEGSDEYTSAQCSEYRREMSDLDDTLNVIKKLNNYSIVSEVVGDGGKRRTQLDGQMLIALKPQEDEPGQLSVTRMYFTKAKSNLAVEEYHKLENEPGYKAVVLVSVKNVGDLKKAYPNYFADSHMFIQFYWHQMKLFNQDLKKDLSELKSELEELERC
ncbi:MAG: ppGpp synthetase/RelA/SpoT-type nucleotidyltransferase [Phenylobacterium sp.]|jgi:ppGpp synthetase/RelA/SpoT-type nucleotidyltranferase